MVQLDQDTDISNNELELLFVDQVIAEIGKGSENVIPILQAIQEHYRYLPEAALERVCELTEITPAQITGVGTFYSQFRHTPVGKHIISVCHGTACHVKGSVLIQEAICRHLGITEGNDTDPDGLFTIQKVACLGCCTLAPVLQIDGVTYGHLTTDTVPRVLRDFLESEHSISKSTEELPLEQVQTSDWEIRLCLDSCCVANGTGNLRDALEIALKEIGSQLKVKRVGCVGMCYQTPILEMVSPQEKSFLYARVNPEDAKAIILRHIKPRGVSRKLGNSISKLLDNILTDETWEPVTRYSIGVRDAPVADFIEPQKHIATDHFGYINPTDIDEYLKYDGFKALEKCLTKLTPDDIIGEVKSSLLRGRGGGGFPTGLKWSLVRQAKGDVKYLICNGDEGDPGAFMDRVILESYPYRVIEGITIAAYAIGIHEGYIYIRAEYPFAIKRMKAALIMCRERGFTGDNIMGSGFNLHLNIMEGAGAFVCGEETALIASIEGKRGMPRLRPPYPSDKGLWGCPTLINNVETFVNIPWIIQNGAEAYIKFGKEDSRGTKVFALAGKVKRGGLIEISMGIPVSQIIDEIGGGPVDGRKIKAIQIGGPSGGCIPASLAHTSVDYESLNALGAIMGSGGLVVLDDTDCMVDIARYFLEFTQDQSCGKCTYCRVGTRRILDILVRICEGKGEKKDLKELEELALMVRKGSLCGLGKTAPNPVLTTLKYFRDEYDAHLEGRCPAGKCKALITYSITDECIGCTICAQRCPAYAIAMKPYEKHEIDPEKCIRCGTCKQVCPSKAVVVR